jgi:hypothetical protein
MPLSPSMGRVSPDTSHGEQKKERLHKLGGKPMKQYNMTHTAMKSQSRPSRENTADVDTTPSKELGQSDTTGRSDTTIALQQRGNPAFLRTLAEVVTSPNNSAEEEPTSVMLLYRMGVALQAAERTHLFISQKRKPVGFVNNEARVKEGIASFLQLVQSISKVDDQLDFPAAMDWLERKSKTGTSLIIDFTRADDDYSSTDDSSASSDHNSDDSNYMEGVGDSKPRHKKRTSHSKQKHSDEGDCPPNANENLVILSSVGGDDIEETSNDKEEEIIE